ncbi:hypothetical protein H6G76_34775 [Nostoc sp. FACHB-152]|uniref:calcium-binding protein n=1 Tax=Nostoc sp. FACHB-152 TaxID=2692837 RepID=UPI001681F4EA|nr:calcium-binding protein [Nostoc sp. FACHB-152]MBD2452180.1 hypothetical protein [Nostoc sp. FACHB-152]
MSEISLPTDLIDSSGFRWDIQGNGSISDGTNDAYDGGLSLAGFYPSLNTAQTEDNGREVLIGTVSDYPAVQVQRKIYVPEDQSWARFLEIVTNTTSATANYTVNLNSYLGSSYSTVVDTSSGDNIFNTDDNWLVTDDGDGTGDPTLVHIIAGENRDVRPDTASLNYGYNVNFAYNLTLAPGETQIVMHFAAQNSDQATALTKAEDLASLGLDALAGISSQELEQIVNFATTAVVSLSGSENEDVLTGSNRREIISGFGGSDVLQGFGGSDQIFGDSGDDLITGGNGRDLLIGGTGEDLIFGDAGNDFIDGGDDNDNIDGGESNDSISGGEGNDRIFGRNGNDTIGGGNGDDIIDGGEGNDSISGGEGSDRIFGRNGNDILSGEAGADILIAGAGNDIIDGGEGNDRLIGVEDGVGWGSGEVDTLTGSLGNDTFVLGDSNFVYYDDGQSFTTGESDYALIADFDFNQDLIQLKGSKDFYSLDFFTSATGTTNAALIYDPGATALGEVISVLQNVSLDLNLSSSAFTFV